MLELINVSVIFEFSFIKLHIRLFVPVINPDLYYSVLFFCCMSFHVCYAVSLLENSRNIGNVYTFFLNFLGF